MSLFNGILLRAQLKIDREGNPRTACVTPTSACA
jgi:hypothetical protein